MAREAHAPGHELSNNRAWRSRIQACSAPNGVHRRWPSAAEAPEPAVVLLAEDDRDMRSMLASALRREGYEVVEAKDGSELLELLGTGHLRLRIGPDLVVSDIRMPGWTGMDVLAGLRHSDWAMPVILITAFGDASTHREARRLGAVTVLDKPFDVDTLLKLAKDVVPPFLC